MEKFQSALLLLVAKLDEAQRDPMHDKDFVSALTEVLRYFRDNGELKKAYDLADKRIDRILGK